MSQPMSADSPSRPSSRPGLDTGRTLPGFGELASLTGMEIKQMIKTFKSHLTDPTRKWRKKDRHREREREKKIGNASVGDQEGVQMNREG